MQRFENDKIISTWDQHIFLTDTDFMQFLKIIDENRSQLVRMKLTLWNWSMDLSMPATNVKSMVRDMQFDFEILTELWTCSMTLSINVRSSFERVKCVDNISSRSSHSIFQLINDKLHGKTCFQLTSRRQVRIARRCVSERRSFSNGFLMKIGTIKQ